MLHVGRVHYLGIFVLPSNSSGCLTESVTVFSSPLGDVHKGKVEEVLLRISTLGRENGRGSVLANRMTPEACEPVQGTSSSIHSYPVALIFEFLP